MINNLYLVILSSSEDRSYLQKFFGSDVLSTSVDEFAELVQSRLLVNFDGPTLKNFRTFLKDNDKDCQCPQTRLFKRKTRGNQ